MRERSSNIYAVPIAIGMLQFETLQINFKHMKYISTFALSLILVVLYTSCDGDRFEQVVEIEIPPHESRLVTNAIFLSTADSLSTFVSNSLSILEEENFNDSETASIRLLKNDNELGQFTYDAVNGVYTNKLNNALGNDVATYRLELEDGAFPKATAVQAMPVAPVIGEIEVEEEGALNDEGDKNDAIEIEIIDSGASSDYYGIKAFLEGYNIIPNTTDTIWYSSSLYLNSNNPLAYYANENNLGLIISDASFNGTTYRLNTYTYSDLPFDQAGDFFIRIELINITEDTYLYSRSLQQYYDSVDNPFAEPVTVHSNLENGYGIFGLGNVSEKSVQLK